MMTGLVVQDQNLEKHIEKQMGCLAGIFQIFDRHHAFTGCHHKRLHSTNCLQVGNTDITPSRPSPSRSVEAQAKPPIFDNKSSWKFSKESSPRLSLDSRANFDLAKGTFKPREIRTVNNVEKTDGRDTDTPRRSTSVIARLMGLDPIPGYPKPELRRSASESCTSKDLLDYRFIDGVNLHRGCNNAIEEPRSDPKVAVRAEPMAMARRRFFNSSDFFPEPPSVYGEIEKRLRMRGIDDPCKDLETLKHILDALQLKGLLYSKRTSSFAPERVHVNRPERASPTRERSPSRRQLPVQQRRVSQRSRPEARVRKEGGGGGGGGGKSILKRCDKLIHRIAEMTAELQPSPVSVLDFYKEEESSPPPIMKRNVVHFGDQLPEVEDDIWSPSFSPTQSKGEEDSDDCDYLYIADVLRASSYLPEDSDIFQLLEKKLQHLKAKDTSDICRLQRKLIFDTITEIIKGKRELPPWKVVPNSEHSSLRQIWSEFVSIRDRDDASDDLLEAINGVLRKDLSKDAINGWEDSHIELSNAILDIERLIFKELISETIQDLAAFAGTFVTPLTRRRLVF